MTAEQPDEYVRISDVACKNCARYKHGCGIVSTHDLSCFVPNTAIRSRPHTPASTRCNSCIFGNTEARQTLHVPSVSRNKEGDLTLTFNHDGLVQHDAAIAHATTLAAQNDIPGFIDTICFIDLYQYVYNKKDIEDISKCRGKECNYCGKFNESLRTQSTTAQESRP
jgi:hypothetical protein